MRVLARRVFFTLMVPFMFAPASFDGLLTAAWPLHELAPTEQCARGLFLSAGLETDETHHFLFRPRTSLFLFDSVGVTRGICLGPSSADWQLGKGNCSRLQTLTFSEFKDYFRRRSDLKQMIPEERLGTLLDDAYAWLAKGKWCAELGCGFSPYVGQPADGVIDWPMDRSAFWTVMQEIGRDDTRPLSYLIGALATQAFLSKFATRTSVAPEASFFQMAATGVFELVVPARVHEGEAIVFSSSGKTTRIEKDRPVAKEGYVLSKMVHAYLDLEQADFGSLLVVPGTGEEIAQKSVLYFSGLSALHADAAGEVFCVNGYRDSALTRLAARLCIGRRGELGRISAVNTSIDRVHRSLGSAIVYRE